MCLLCFRLKMTSEKQVLNLYDERDIQNIQRLLFDGTISLSDEEESDREDLSSKNEKAATTIYEIENEDEDTDASEGVEERKDLGKNSR